MRLLEGGEQSALQSAMRMTRAVPPAQVVWIGAALGAALLARAPFAFADRPFHDEPVYAFVAAAWLEGVIPYRDMWDVKPPGLFALYALAQALGASPLASVWILPLIAACAAALGLCALGRFWFADLRIGALAGVLFAWFSLASGGARGPAVFLAAPFVIWGLCLARGAAVPHAFLSGLSLGCAGMILQSSVFEALFAFALVCLLGPRASTRARLRRACAFALGGLLPALGLGALLGAQGAFGEAWEAVVLVALARSVHHAIGFLDGAGLRFIERIEPFAPLCLAGAAWVFGLARKKDAQARASAWIVSGWVCVAAAGALVQRAAHDAYMLPLVAPLCLLAACLGIDALDRWRGGPARVLMGAAACLGLLFPAYAIVMGVLWGGHVRIVRDAARIITERARHPGESAGLYVGDVDIALHLLTKEPPVSRFFYPMHLQCPFPLPAGIDQEAEIRRIMARAPRFVTLRDPARIATCTPPDRRALLQGFLDAAYAQIGEAGRSGEVRVYELRQGMAQRLRAR